MELDRQTLTISPAAGLDTRLADQLQRRFGLPALRGLQAPVIAGVLAGQDVLALMPTGAGKSLCYQLPCCLRPGLALVISPLLALMRDQQQRLARLSIPARAMTGTLDRAALRLLGQELHQQRWRVLLLSPERVLQGPVASLLQQPSVSANIDLLVVDEAHCIPDWGPAFRPAFAGLGQLRQRFPAASVLALTASANRSARADILRVLHMPHAQVLEASFNRPELFYRVQASASPWRHALAYLQAYHPLDSALFYCQRRHETMQVAALLQAAGVPARAYHAGLPADQRRLAEQWFMARNDAVMVATIAFGMGIDKPDIRLVVHAGLPVALPAYYQETGRAGRDGQRATALLLVPANADGQQVSGFDLPADDPAASMQRYVSGTGCRRALLLAGLTQSLPGACDGCDRCHPAWRPLPALRAVGLAWVPAVRSRRAQGATGGTRTRMPDGARF